jgi:hypothetical protein
MALSHISLNISNALWDNLNVPVFLKYRDKEIEYITFRLQILLNASSATTQICYLLGENLHPVRQTRGEIWNRIFA